MTQLHFTVDERTAKRLEKEARQRGMSLSKYIASIVCREIPQAWPPGYLETVVGACARHPLEVPDDPPPDDLTLPGD